MKLLIAIIHPDMLNDVLQHLKDAQLPLVTVSPAMGRGRRDKVIAEVYRGHTEAGSLRKKVRLELALNDDAVETAIEAILNGARTGNPGDGKIFVYPLEECIRIRNGERGIRAIG